MFQVQKRFRDRYATPTEGAGFGIGFPCSCRRARKQKLSAAALDSKGEREAVDSKADTSPLVGLTGRFLYFPQAPVEIQDYGPDPCRTNLSRRSAP